jgi:hypothetical protein
MRTLLFGLVLTIGTLSAQASMLEVNGPLDEKLFDAQVNDEKTHFETLGDLFKAGRLPDLNKISNIAWAGRCFIRSEPNEPTNAGYIFGQKRNEAGPIGATSKIYGASSYWKLTKAPNYYDKMSLEQVLSLYKDTLIFNVARVKSDSVEVDISDGSKSNLKVSGNYLVEELSGTDGDVGPVGKVSVYSRCYYFIPDLND